MNTSSTKRLVAFLVVLGVALATLWWSFNRTQPDATPSPATVAASTPVAEESATGGAVLPIAPEDMTAAQHAARIVLRMYFASPRPGEDVLGGIKDVATPRLQSVIAEQWKGLTPDQSIVINNLTLLDDALPHELRQIVLAAQVEWTATYGQGVEPETHQSIATVTVVQDNGWKVDFIEETDGYLEEESEG